MSAAEGPLVVGVDTSTQSTKALVVDVATGRVVASGQAPHTVSSEPAARATPGSGGTRCARRCASAATRRTRPPRCRSAASSTGW